MPSDNDYMRQYMAQRRARRRQSLVELSGGKCEGRFYDEEDCCGSTDRLEFDHINPATRLFSLSGKGLDREWSLIVQEHAKCQLLCYQCHRTKTVRAGEAGGGHNKLVDYQNWPHGSMQRYMVNRCRCIDCKFAKMLYRSKEIGYREIVVAPEGWRRGSIPR